MKKTLILKEFIQKAKNLYGDLYTYEKVIYINYSTKVTITCPIHGDFNITPGNFLSGCRCKECSFINIKLSIEEFISRSNKVHNNKYTYNKVDYKDNNTKVIITCPIHGDFEQIPRNHLNGVGCKFCYYDSKRDSLETVIEKFNIVHCNKYNYSKSIYNGNDKKIIITCPIHGDFEQVVGKHLSGTGCPECYICEKTMSLDEFLKKVYNLQGDRYIIVENTYKNAKSPVDIICEFHGRVTVKSAWNMLNGSGCPKCAGSNPEKLISNYLYDLNIKFIREYMLPFYKFRWDFYLPEFNIFIEFHGEQHFKHINYFTDKEGFETLQFRDKMKKTLVSEYKGRLITLDYVDLKNKTIKNKLYSCLKKFKVIY